jgi:putative drug exporter of the RND superfamily
MGRDGRPPYVRPQPITDWRKQMKAHGIAARAGGWSARHRAKAIFGWLVFVVLALVVAGGVGTKKLSTTETLDGQSAAASRTLDLAGFDRPAAEQILVQARGSGSVLTASGRAAIRDLGDALRATGRVRDVLSPLSAGNGGQLSRGRRSAVVLFAIRGKADTADKRVAPVLAAVARVARAHADLRIEEFGDASATRALNKTLGKDFSRAEGISVPLTFVILLLAFGAVLAAIVPLGLALTAVAAGGGLLALSSHGLHVDGSSSTVLLLIGLAVGVDYSLFYIRRAGEERARGRSPRSAVEAAAATSGRSVLISGLTVIVAMAGMFITGQGTFMGMAEATVLVVAVAVLGSLTVLPATLSLLGERIDRGRIPWLGKWMQRRRRSGPSRFWSAVLGRVVARPRASTAVAVMVLVALAAPAVFLHTAILSPAQDLPRDLPVMKTYSRLQRAFPGGALPAQVVVSARDVTSPRVSSQISALRRHAIASGQMFDPITVAVNPARTVAAVDIPLAGDGQDAQSRRALDVLRNRIIPATVGRVATADVTGPTASSVDFNSRLKARAVLVVLFVLGVAFVLLVASFRSVVIAATGLALNLLSVSAAYGVLVAVFQWGWGKSLLGLSSTGTIAAWLPLFMFVILFGLSMDYHVFSVSRIKEEHDRGAPTRRAIHDGIARSAGVITSAAIIMVVVFSTFATLSQTSMKQLGVGLAVAVLLDATIVRAVLLPATMTLLGDRNWSSRRRLRPVASPTPTRAAT